MTTVLRSERPAARKAHVCDLCNAIIQPGDVYDRQTNIFDGRLYDWISCRGPVGCNAVAHAVWSDPEWSPDYYDEGLTAERAHEWATETVRATGSMLAAAYLTRIEIAHRRYYLARLSAVAA